MLCLLWLLSYGAVTPPPTPAANADEIKSWLYTHIGKPAQNIYQLLLPK